jgi:hypothetical protein
MFALIDDSHHLSHKEDKHPGNPLNTTHHKQAKRITTDEISVEVRKDGDITPLLWKSDLSKRAINVCKLHDFTSRQQVKMGFLRIEEFQPLATVRDLSRWSKKELLELQNCGDKTIIEFERLLSKYSLCLKE